MLDIGLLVQQQSDVINVGLALKQRSLSRSLQLSLRRWTNIKPTLFQCVVFAGTALVIRAGTRDSRKQGRPDICP